MRGPAVDDGPRFLEAERLLRLGADDAIDDDPFLGLEGGDRKGRGVAEDAVDRPGVDARRDQRVLNGRDLRPTGEGRRQLNDILRYSELGRASRLGISDARNEETRAPRAGVRLWEDRDADLGAVRLDRMIVAARNRDMANLDPRISRAADQDRAGVAIASATGITPPSLIASSCHQPE